MNELVVPIAVVPFIIGFAPGKPRLTYAAGVWLSGYYWALVAQLLLAAFAVHCLKGWK